MFSLSLLDLRILLFEHSKTVVITVGAYKLNIYKQGPTLFPKRKTLHQVLLRINHIYIPDPCQKFWLLCYFLGPTKQVLCVCRWFLAFLLRKLSSGVKNYEVNGHQPIWQCHQVMLPYMLQGKSFPVESMSRKKNKKGPISTKLSISWVIYEI